MRKGLLLSFVLAISFMMFFWVGCVHDEIDLVNHTEEFMKEARFYFEENAPGIQLVRLGEDKKEGAKSTSFSSRIIIPDWEKQEAFKFGAISTLEIPLTGDVFMKSSYSRRLGNGIFRHSLADVSTKLIIQKHDELKALRFFIVTIIGEETEEYIDASREYGYVQSRDFSGLMIFSDLEGNYFEAYQFDRGEKKRVRLAKTGGDSKVQPEDIVQ